ncbi:MAG: PAS domain-containing protein, partial [Bradymonadaceae bacterium]
MRIQSSPNIPFINSALVRWFISPDLRDASTYAAYNQRAVIVMSLSLVLWGPVFGVVHLLAFNVLWMTFAVMSTALAFLAALTLIRFTKSTQWASQIICSTLYILLIALTSNTGGIASPVSSWFLLVPVLASVFLERRLWTYTWTGLVILALMGLFTASYWGWDTTSVLKVPWQDSLLFMATITSLIIAVLMMFAIRYEIETWVLNEARRSEEKLRRAHQKASEQSKESLHALIKHSPEGIVVHHDGNVVYANPAFRQLGKYDKDSIDDLPINDLLKTTQPAVERTTPVLRNRHDSTLADEHQVVCKDGLQVPVEVTTFMANFDNT